MKGGSHSGEFILQRIARWEEVAKDNQDWFRDIQGLKEIAPSLIEQYKLFPGYEEVFKDFVDGHAIWFFEEKRTEAKRLIKFGNDLILNSDRAVVLNRYRHNKNVPNLIAELVAGRLSKWSNEYREELDELFRDHYDLILHAGVVLWSSDKWAKEKYEDEFRATLLADFVDGLIIQDIKGDEKGRDLLQPVLDVMEDFKASTFFVELSVNAYYAPSKVFSVNGITSNVREELYRYISGGELSDAKDVGRFFKKWVKEEKEKYGNRFSNREMGYILFYLMEAEVFKRSATREVMEEYAKEITGGQKYCGQNIYDHSNSLRAAGDSKGWKGIDRAAIFKILPTLKKYSLVAVSLANDHIMEISEWENENINKPEPTTKAKKSL